MLLTFTDFVSGNSININPKYVVVVFTITEENIEKTIINTITGNVVVKESQIEVVGQLQGQLS
jgi:hypothetical protein